MRHGYREQRRQNHIYEYGRIGLTAFAGLHAFNLDTRRVSSIRSATRNGARPRVRATMASSGTKLVQHAGTDEIDPSAKRWNARSSPHCGRRATTSIS
jgi:hypothetical protein